MTLKKLFNMIETSPSRGPLALAKKVICVSGGSSRDRLRSDREGSITLGGHGDRRAGSG